jgi:simple sugar transport system substrate-binding protein
MKKSTLWRLLCLTLVLIFVISACTSAEQTEEPGNEPETAETSEVAATEEPGTVVEPTETQAPTVEEGLTFGMLMVGPYNDRGWSQAHYDAGLYLEEKIPGAKMVYVDKVNPADRPGTTPAQLAEELLTQGAAFVIFNSDDMKDSALDFARAHPDVPVIHASGDSAWVDGQAYQNLPNMINIMGKMEYGKMMAGCTAALTTQTGNIGYLGPLINDETRRLAASAYLGARYCWENYLGNDPADLGFKVTWIGFWFNIPGVTSDPTQVADDFFNSGYDVVISGIDTTEGLAEAKKLSANGQAVWAIPYDYVGSCQEAPEVCLGVPYFNWGPAYLETAQSYLDGTLASKWEWNAPDWSDINNVDTTAIGFVKGDALSEGAAAQVDQFIAELAGGLYLWTGRINLQDGTQYLADGEVATDQQIWYLPQLLEGMEGQSVPSN